MTIKRIFLTILTLLISFKLVFAVVGSLSEPQVQGRLELYQTNLVLHTGELAKHPETVDRNLIEISDALSQEDPLTAAAQQYQKVKQNAVKSLATLENKLAELKVKNQEGLVPQAEAATTLPEQQFQSAIAESQQLVAELDLEIGIIEASRGNQEQAATIWQNIITKAETNPQLTEISNITRAISGLWQEQPVILPDTENLIHQHLHSWFRYRSLEQLYQVQGSKQELLDLEKQETITAEQSLFKLGFIVGIPLIGGIIGILLVLGLGIQLIIKRERAILATNHDLAWDTPWDWETTWQVIIVGFFFVGQILLPLLIGITGFNPIGLNLRFKAIYILIDYILMAGASLSVLYFSIKSFFPLPQDWFKPKWISNWFMWGFGGYLIAIPLVLLVSLLNQQLWQGQGGSNPLLSLALESQDQVALAIFFCTAAIAAPIFEETIFRGFLLPSLTPYLPVWSSILLSGLLFAIAHLSISEILPLTTLGIILGVVYTRSRSILAPMLLHSLWNSGTLLTLYILGSQ